MFIIDGISNFEDLKIKNLDKGHLNSALTHAKTDFHAVFQAKPITKPYGGLCKCSRG
jgi:hypothetical protein